MDHTSPEATLELLQMQLKKTLAFADNTSTDPVPEAQQETALAQMVQELYEGDGPLATALAGDNELLPVILAQVHEGFNAQDPFAVEWLKYKIATDLVQLEPQRIGLNGAQAEGLAAQLNKVGELCFDPSQGELGSLNRATLKMVEGARNNGLLHLSKADAQAKLSSSTLPTPNKPSI